MSQPRDARLPGSWDAAALTRAVQANCDRADARHAADAGLCTYLLQMREFYRWERGIAFGQALDRAEVGRWIGERERWWESLESSDYRALPLGDGLEVDPFDAPAVNAQLEGRGLLYGAGTVGAGRPVFFLADLHSLSWFEGLPVQQAGAELARGLLAPPAALAGAGQGPIVVRRQSMARWGWERVEAWRLRPQPGTAMHEVVQAYGLDPDFMAGLPAWLDDQIAIALMHEAGEFRVGQALGPAWSQMRGELPTARLEWVARAIKDHLADLQFTLPALLEPGRPRPPVHAWFAGFDGLRAALFPGLPAAYDGWRTGQQPEQLAARVAQANQHFQALAGELLQLWNARGPQAIPEIAARLEPAAAAFTG